MNRITAPLNPLAFFRKLDGEKQICFLKSAGSRGWGTLIAFNPAARFSCRAGGLNRFKSFLRYHTRKGRKLIGYFSYDLGYELHRVTRTALDDLQLPDIFFYAFDNYLRFDNDTAEMHFTDRAFPGLVAEISRRALPPRPESPGGTFRPVTSREQYARAYKKIQRYILEGDVYQINLTHRLEARTGLAPRSLFANIIEQNPVDFLAYIEGDGFEILSASPERFIKISDKQIETCPIKGTRPRGGTPEIDSRYRQELIQNSKEAAELNMITDLLRNDLGKVCDINTVKVAGSRLISECPTVWHTYSRITGTVSDRLTPVDALVSMLPGGSITGCPKKRAMEIIDELEPTTRSVYTGTIGYIDPNLDLDFSIAIRTIIKKDQRLFLQVGGGIVLDSEEHAEFRETLDKAASFMHIL